MFGFGFWIKVGIAIAVAFVVAAIWWRLNHWCNAACRDLKDDVAELTQDVAERDASIKTTQDRATAMALLWSDQVTKTETVARKTEVDRAQTFAKLRDDANHIGTGSGVRFSDAGLSLFRSARSAASGEATGPAAKPTEAAPAPASSAEEFVVSLYEWAAICRARVDSWASFYKGLQDASSSVAATPAP